MMNIVSSWSGGKDSCFALMQALADGHRLKVLLNMMNENGKVSRSHAIPLKILQQQVAAINIPPHTVASSLADYENNFITALQELKEAYQLEGAVFGDIDLQPHRNWEEKVCNEANIKAMLPLWQQSRKPLVLEMIAAGIEATIVSCNTTMDTDFLGNKIDYSLIETLERMGIDACGENGEYHTLVTNCPLFKNAVSVTFGSKRQYNDYCFIEMITT
ncbi:MAG TPA: diphthine--ammonia ligase [Hanamia sp.]